jgi:hypothetical protein
MVFAEKELSWMVKAIRYAALAKEFGLGGTMRQDEVDDSLEGV